MKKLINAPEDVLVESLKGVAAAHPELSVDLENHVITRATPKEQGKVAVVSGGGSGHEPLHGGYVGTGMLDAAVAGDDPELLGELVVDLLGQGVPHDKDGRRPGDGGERDEEGDDGGDELRRQRQRPQAPRHRGVPAETPAGLRT